MLLDSESFDKGSCSGVHRPRPRLHPASPSKSCATHYSNICSQPERVQSGSNPVEIVGCREHFQKVGSNASGWRGQGDNNRQRSNQGIFAGITESTRCSKGSLFRCECQHSEDLCWITFRRLLLIPSRQVEIAQEVRLFLQ